MSVQIVSVDAYTSTDLRGDIDEVVAALRHQRERSLAQRQRAHHPPRLPSRKVLGGIIEGLSAALFPNRLSGHDLSDDSVDYFVGHTLDTTLRRLHGQVRRELQYAAGMKDDPDADRQRAMDITRAFAAQLPEVRALLDSDIRAAYEGDPAASGEDEVLVCYPGITAIIHHRR